MKKTPLKRKTPLKSNGCKLKRTPFKVKPKKSVAKKSPDLIEQLDKVFSKYIRLRDMLPDGDFICISCGRKLPFSYSQCGHYHPRANMSTRFDEDNCHSECVECNCFEQNHLEGYRRNLIAKIGEERVLELDKRAKETKKWSHYELGELIAYYKEKIKQMQDC